MTQALINQAEWLEENSSICFKSIPKAYFKEYLIKVSLRVPGANKRYYYTPWKGEPDYTTGIDVKQHRNFPTQQEFTDWWFNDSNDDAKKSMRWPQNWYKGIQDPNAITLPQLKNNRYILDVTQYQAHCLINVDTHVLWKLHRARVYKQKDIRFGRSQKLIFIYCKTEERIREMLEQLDLSAEDIREIHYAKPEHVELIKDGKEYSKWGKDWKYKVFFKEMSEPNPDLYVYLSSLERQGLCFIPYVTIEKILKERTIKRGASASGAGFWVSPWGRSHVYINDIKLILMFQMLAPGKYSNYIELVPLVDK